MRKGFHPKKLAPYFCALLSRPFQFSPMACDILNSIFNLKICTFEKFHTGSGHYG